MRQIITILVMLLFVTACSHTPQLSNQPSLVASKQAAIETAVKQ